MQISFPSYSFRIKKSGERQFIFDIIRKKFVALTPEEWVRQHWIHYLITEKKFPRSLMSVEKQLKVNQLSKRCDIVIYNSGGVPVMIVECKSADVILSQKTFDQIARYNLSLKVKYLVVSNGSQTYCCEVDFESGTYYFLEEIPSAEK